MTILQIDSSARTESSLSRQVTSYLAQQLGKNTGDSIVHRDLNRTNLPLVTEAHIHAYYTRANERTLEQRALLQPSDQLIDELKTAHTVVIGAPMYNFSVTASLKAWIDLVCRVGETFIYGDSGPEGLLKAQRAFIVVAAGGTPIGSEVDFVSAYLKQVCRFVGIEEVHIIDVSGSKRDPEALIDIAKQQIDELLA